MEQCCPRGGNCQALVLHWGQATGGCICPWPSPCQHHWLTLPFCCSGCIAHREKFCGFAYLACPAVCGDGVVKVIGKLCEGFLVRTEFFVRIADVCLGPGLLRPGGARTLATITQTWGISSMVGGGSYRLFAVVLTHPVSLWHQLSGCLWHVFRLWASAVQPSCAPSWDLSATHVSL